MYNCPRAQAQRAQAALPLRHGNLRIGPAALVVQVWDFDVAAWLVFTGLSFGPGSASPLHGNTTTLSEHSGACEA